MLVIVKYTPDTKITRNLLIYLQDQGSSVWFEATTDQIMDRLQYGEALNEIREVFPSNEEFGQYLVAEGLDVYPNVVLANLAKTKVHPKDRLAAMWAAANPNVVSAKLAGRKTHDHDRLAAMWAAGRPTKYN